MYCIKCGVELADSEKACPLCGTVVYNPDVVRKELDPPYPVYEPNDTKMNKKGVLFIVTLLFVSLIAQLVICDVSISAAKGWSEYAIGAALLAYIIIVLPIWFHRPNPVIFVPCDFAAILLYLLFIDLRVDGNWFLSFVLPTVGVMAILTTAVVTLVKYLRRGYLYIFGGAIIMHGGFMVFLEFLINNTFHVSDTFKWSYFPLIGCLIIGLSLILIAICKPLQESLKKKFFV